MHAKGLRHLNLDTQGALIVIPGTFLAFEVDGWAPCVVEKENSRGECRHMTGPEDGPVSASEAAVKELPRARGRSFGGALWRGTCWEVTWRAVQSTPSPPANPTTTSLGCRALWPPPFVPKPEDPMEWDCHAGTGTSTGPAPLCDIPSGCCFFTGPWTVTRSFLCLLLRVAALCRLLQPVLLLVSFPRSRSPVVGVLGLCWMWQDVPFAH